MIRFTPALLLMVSCIAPQITSIDLLENKASWSESNYGSNGEINFSKNLLSLDMGDPITGVTWNKRLPASVNYEICLEAKRTQGNDFFCGLTFPVNQSQLSLILSGWGGTVTGISSLDGLDASENHTSQTIYFKDNQWYKIRLQVTDKLIQVWIDQELIIIFNHTKHKLSIRPEVTPSTPLGLATFYTAAQYRNFHFTKMN